MAALALPTDKPSAILADPLPQRYDWAAARLERAKLRGELRTRFASFKPRSPAPEFHTDLERGWLLPTLLQMDALLYGRWEYWARTTDAQVLQDDPIPSIDWMGPDDGQKVYECAKTPARPMLEASLDCIGQKPWKKWDSWDGIRYLLDWLLFSFGCELQPDMPVEPEGCAGASDRLYQVFCVDTLQLWPYDHLGDILCESKYGRKNGFFPTPMPLVEFLVERSFAECTTVEDKRLAKTLDPCLGTGRFLLSASNQSLRLYGMDIDPTMVRASAVNGYLYAPWMVRPFAFLQDVEETVTEAEITAPAEGQWRQGVLQL